MRSYWDLLIYMNPFMALSLLIIAGITALLIICGFKGITGRCGIRTREAITEKLKHMNQAVNGIKEILVAQRRTYFWSSLNIQLRWQQIVIQYIFGLVRRRIV